MSAAMGASENLGDQLRALTENTASYMTYGTHVIRIHQPETLMLGSEASDPLTRTFSPDQEYLEPHIFESMVGGIGPEKTDEQEYVPAHLARTAVSNVVDLGLYRQYRQRMPR